MLMIGNLTPDLEVETFMPDGRFERLRLGALAGRDGAARPGLPGGVTACEWQPGDDLLVAA